MSNDPPEMRDWAWLLLLPSLLWFAGLLCYLRESAVSPTNKKAAA